MAAPRTLVGVNVFFVSGESKAVPYFDQGPREHPIPGCFCPGLRLTHLATSRGEPPVKPRQLPPLDPTIQQEE